MIYRINAGFQPRTILAGKAIMETYHTHLRANAWSTIEKLRRCANPMTLGAMADFCRAVDLDASFIDNVFEVGFPGAKMVLEQKDPGGPSNPNNLFS